MKILLFISLMFVSNAFSSEKLSLSYMEELIKKQCGFKMVKVIQEYESSGFLGSKVSQRYICKEIAINIEINENFSFGTNEKEMIINVYQKSLNLGYFSTKKEHELNKMNFIIASQYNNSSGFSTNHKRQILQDLVK